MARHRTRAGRVMAAVAAAAAFHAGLGLATDPTICFAPNSDDAARLADCGATANDPSLPVGVRANAFVALAELQAARGLQAEALKDYDTAIALDRKDTAAILARGKLFEMMGHDDRAAADYTTVLAMEKSSAEAFVRRGLLRLKSNNPAIVAGALNDLSEARHLNPRDAMILRHLATAQLRTDRNADAIATFSAILSTSPDDMDALHGRATANGRMGNFDSAIADLDHILKIRPDDPETLKTRGVAALHHDQFVPAIADFTRALARTPADVESLFFRATARFRAGDIVGAETDFDAVLTLRPDEPDARAGRGLARMTEGRLAEAEADFTAALSVAPHAGGLLADRGRLRVLRGDNAGAARDLESAMTTPAASLSTAIWRFVASRQSGGGDKAALSAARERFGDAAWPGPIARYLLGEISAADALRAAGEDSVQISEACYFAGQTALARHDQTEAVKQFTAATATSARGSFAYIGAKVELAKLAKQ